jgi:hypothetical protein
MLFAVAAVLLLLAVPGAAPASSRAEEGVVLGSKNFLPYGEGWGSVRPHRISNGGDLSGLITHVHWRSWGGQVARGRGLNSIFKPSGGYYKHPVHIKLKATNKGRCTSRGPVAYRRLSFRSPKKPGGHLGPWRLWSGQHSICKFGF